VQVLNASFSSFPRVTIEAKLYDREMKELWNIGEATDLKENVLLSWQDTVPVADALSFLKLKATGQDGTILADNFYWLHAGNDFSSLHSLNRPNLAITSLTPMEGEETGYIFVITNMGEGLALMTRLRLTDPETGLEVLPTYWSDNFISLMPGEAKRLVLSTDSPGLPENLHLSYKSFNMDSAESIPLGNH
jgi:exo-1,4-beta-D-glucosaminidase